MKIELNPLNWFQRKAGVAAAAPVAAAVVGSLAIAGDPVREVSKPAKAVENAMATTAVVPQSGFKSVMAHILKFVTLGLVDVIKYTPNVAALAAVLFPAEAPLEAAASAVTVQVATLLRNTVLSVQAKWAGAPAGSETNAAKLADALAIAEAPSISLLKTAGIHADTSRITAAIDATVAILKLSPAPADGAAATTAAAPAQ